MKLSEFKDKVNEVAEQTDGDPYVLTEVDPNGDYNVYDIHSVRLFKVEDEEDLNRTRVSDAEIGDEFVMVNFYQ